MSIECLDDRPVKVGPMKVELLRLSGPSGIEAEVFR